MSNDKSIKFRFGQLLRKRRLQQKLNLKALAQISGLGKSCISDWEKGRFLPRKENLETLLPFLKYDKDEEQEVMQLWQEAQAEKQVETAEDSLQDLLSFCEKLHDERRPNPPDRDFALVKQDDLKKLIDLARRVARFQKPG